MSTTDPAKLRALLRDSQQESEPEPEPELDEPAESPEDSMEDEDLASDDAPELGEATVESLAEALKPAVPTINAIVDDFRAGNEAQPHEGIEVLEEELDAATVHHFCQWVYEAGKKDFRALGDALDVEDIDGFVGLCRAIAANQDEHAEGVAEEEGGEEEGEQGEPEGGEEEPEGEEGGEENG